MKTHSRKELIVLSIAVFQEHRVGSLFATADGQFFIHEDRAKLHNRSLRGGKIHEIDESEAREAVEAIEVETDQINNTESPILAKNANDAVEAISGVETVEALTLLNTEEAEGKNRKTVLKAIANRIDAVNAKDAGESEGADNKE